jgi:hypothetical protein
MVGDRTPGRIMRGHGTRGATAFAFLAPFATGRLVDRIDAGAR